MHIEFDSDPVYGDKCIKSKIRSYGNEIKTNFQKKGIPKENVSYKCLSVMMLESVVKVKKKHHHQTFLEEYKYEIKKKNMENLINDDSDSSSFDKSENDESDNGSDNDESSD